MKKMICLIAAMICLVSMITGAACADGGTWYCENCGTDRNTEWCPNCGARRPDNGETDWPMMNLIGSGTALNTLKDKEGRHQSFFGPNRKSYPGAGAYKPYKVTSATALFREGSYVLVDLSYRTVGRRCVYFLASSLVNSNVEELSLNEAYTAITACEYQPRFGPGSIYDPLERTVGDKRYGIRIAKGTKIQVLFEMDHWVFAEFRCALGLVRAWFPLDAVYAA